MNAPCFLCGKHVAPLARVVEQHARRLGAIEQRLRIIDIDNRSIHSGAPAALRVVHTRRVA